MKRILLFVSILFIAKISQAQFVDTSQLRNYIIDTIKDRRPEKVSAIQVQKALLGLYQFRGQADTVSIISRLEQKLNISDTALMLSSYLKQEKDSIALAALQDSLANRLTGLTYRNDSVFTTVNGVETFVYKDPAGGAIPTLQQVLTAGDTAQLNLVIDNPSSTGYLYIGTQQSGKSNTPGAFLNVPGNSGALSVSDIFSKQTHYEVGRIRNQLNNNLYLPDGTGNDTLATVARIRDMTGAVTSVFGRSGAVTGQEGDYSAFYPRMTQFYANPAWISSLSWSKIFGAPSFQTYGDTLTTDATKYDVAVGVSNRITSIIRRGDSVFTKIGTAETFAYLDSVGAGGVFDKVDSITLNSSNNVDTIKYWVNGSSFVSGYIDKKAGLVSGGFVTWTGTGLSFDVTPAVYTILGNRYTSLAGSVTLAAADPTNSRIDVIALDDTGAIVVIQGDASANPVQPQVDPSTQVFLTSVLIGPGSTTPPGISAGLVYDENVEWSSSSSGLTSDFANTANVYSGTKSASLTSISSTGCSVTFTNSTPVNYSDYSALKFFIRINTTTFLKSKPPTVQVTFLKAGTVVSNTLNISAYGFNPSVQNSYQNVSIPMGDFVFTSAQFDAVQLRFTNIASNGYYLDYVQLQSGIIPPVSGGLTNAYATITDGTNNAAANGSDKLKFRTDATLSVTVGSNDATHGDNILLKADTAIIATNARVQHVADSIRALGGVDSASYHSITALADSSGFTLNRPNGTKDTIVLTQPFEDKQSYGDTLTYDATKYYVDSVKSTIASGISQSQLDDSTSALRTDLVPRTELQDSAAAIRGDFPTGVANGDKGDITVSGPTTWSLDQVVNDSKVIDSSISISKIRASGTRNGSTVLAGDSTWKQYTTIDLTGISPGDLLTWDGTKFIKYTKDFITAIRYSNDSVYKTINGTETLAFVIQDSVGSGSSVIDSIQRVGSAGIAHGNIGIDTTINRLVFKSGNFVYRVPITDSIDATDYDIDAQAYINAVNGTDVTLTTPQKQAINDYVIGLKADTLWTKIYDQGLPVWGTAASSAIMLKGTHTVTWANSPSFSSSGVTGNGTSSYGNLNFSPNTAGTQDNSHLAVYVQTNVTGSGIDIGSATLTPTRVSYINTKSGAGTTHHINDATNGSSSVSSSAGFSLASRTVSTGVDFYKNGVFVSTTPGTSTGIATDNYALCAYNGAGSVQSFSTRQISFWSAGSGLTASNATKLSTRVNTLMTALGINVY